MGHRYPYFGPGWARQVGRMVLAWLGLGALVGILSAPPDGGPVGFVAGAVAGMIVLPVFGAVLGLLGGCWWDTLLGAACGLTTALAFVFLDGSIRPAPSISLSLLIGAFAGATVPQMCRLYRFATRQALSQIRSIRAESRGASGGSAVSKAGATNP